MRESLARVARLWHSTRRFTAIRHTGTAHDVPEHKKRTWNIVVTMVVVVEDVGVVVGVLVMMTLAKITATTSTVTKANRNSQSKTDDENHGLQRRYR
jgi:hypothetical protein